MAEVTLIGGHGKVALKAGKLLAMAGHNVTSLIRNPDHLPEVEETGVAARVADVEQLDVDDLAKLFDGQEVVIWSAGAGGGSPERTQAVDRDAAIRSIDAARQAGVDHYVMVSYFGAGTDHQVPADDPFFAYAEAKAAADEHLRGSGLRWTILMPSRLTDDPGTGKIDATAEQASEVPRDDVAEVIRQTLLVGPEATADREIRFNTGDTPIDEVISD